MDQNFNPGLVQEPITYRHLISQLSAFQDSYLTPAHRAGRSPVFQHSVPPFRWEITCALADSSPVVSLEHRIVVRWKKRKGAKNIVAWRKKNSGRVSSKNSASSECSNRLFYVLCMVSGSVFTGFLV